MIDTLEKENVELEAGKLDTQGDLTEAGEQLEMLQTELQNLHAECDFLIDNFDLRQDNFKVEIEGLISAKQTLQGAKLD